MPERSTDGHDGGFDLILGCPNEPAIDASRRLNCITNSVQVDGCQHGVDKSTEAPAPGSFNVVALDSLDLNGRACPQMLRRLQAGKRSHGLDGDRGLRGPAEQSLPSLLPSSVILLASGRGSPTRIYL
jgi:hypothetical protein